MRKIKNIILSTIILALVSECSGYKPIFSSTNLQFKILEYSIEGNKILGNQIYSKLNNISKSRVNNKNSIIINLLIDVEKDKNSAAKDSAGKILEYKTILKTKIIITDSANDKEILNQTFISSTIFKVQDQHSETIKLENNSIQNLIDKTYQELLIKFSQNIIAK